MRAAAPEFYPRETPMEPVQSLISLLMRHPVPGGIGLTLAFTGLFLLAPLGWDRETFFPAYPVLTFVGLMYLAQTPTWIYSLWQPVAIHRFREQFVQAMLPNDDAVGESEWLDTKSSWRLYAAYSAVQGIPLVAILAAGQIGRITWWLYGVPHLAFMVALAVTVVSGAANVRWQWRALGKNELGVLPLHPDGCGGLSFLGNFYVKIYMHGVYLALYLAFTMGVVAAHADQLLPRLEQEGLIFILRAALVVFAVTYVAVVYLLVIRPTRWIQAAMRKPRDRILIGVAGEVDRLQTSLSDLISVKSTHGAAQFKQVDDEIQSLRNLYQSVQATYPTSPFSLTWLRGIQISTVLPLLVGAVPLVIALMKSKN